MGWVYADLVQLSAVASSLPVSTQVLTAPRRSASPAAPGTVATEPAPDAAVHGSLAGTVNIRQGPGVNYARVAVGQAGERYEISAVHSQLPWLQIIDVRSPGGRAWIARDLLQVQGDLSSLPVISRTVLQLPTLTPTPSLGRITAPDGSGSGSGIPPAGFVQLGHQLWDLLLDAGFERESGRPAALYLLDAGSGVSLGFNDQLAFSGTSIQKIGILTTLFSVLDAPLGREDAVDVANTMICSENVATNRLLSRIGAGSPWEGAVRVTRLLASLGLDHSYLVTPYTIPGVTPQPPAGARLTPPQGPGESVAGADPWNRIVAGETGQLLGALHYCAREEVSLLDGSGLTARECRQALQVMRHNTVDALLRAGVPADTQVAHKHGWIDDTHSNAALFHTPGGDYVIVLLLHQPQWLDFRQSLPLMAELSRLVYNFYNPQDPLAAVRSGHIPEAGSCDFRADPLIDELLAAG